MFHHKNIRLSEKNYRGKIGCFLTICCADRKPHFGRRDNCEWLLSILKETATQYSFDIHAYCVMSDHLHFLVQGVKPDSDLLRFVKVFKIRSSREFAARHGCELWQKKYYDHILRERESIESVAWYIWMNPVRARLVVRPQDYPFVGSLTMKIPEVGISREIWMPPYRSEKRPPQKAAATTERIDV
jgi:putative transposase